ncbi:MAG: carbohydrate ABC transporter permease [bacterium]|jgi:multiple sugar transport system permease protein
MKRKNLTRLILLYLASALFLIVFIGPFVWLVSSSFQLERQLVKVPPVWLPDPFSIESYKEIFMGAFFDEAYASAYGVSSSYQSRIYLGSFLNSLIIALSVSFFSVLFGAYAAYPIARLDFRGKYALLFSILVVRLVPALALAIPIVLFAKQMGMHDRLITLIFINMSFVLPYTIWLLQAYFKTIPSELEDAGRIDGCSRLQVVNRIIIPLSIPGLATTGILAFLLSWGEFLFALLITETEKSYTSTVVAAMFATSLDVNYVTIIAAGVLAVIPPVVFALFFQKYIISGLLSGAVKN